MTLYANIWIWVSDYPCPWYAKMRFGMSEYPGICYANMWVKRWSLQFGCRLICLIKLSDYILHIEDRVCLHKGWHWKTNCEIQILNNTPSALKYTIVDFGLHLWTLVHIYGLWSTFVDFGPHLWTLVHICGLWSTFMDFGPHLWTLVHIYGLCSTFVDFGSHLWTLLCICGLWSAFVDFELQLWALIQICGLSPQLWTMVQMD